MLLKICTGGISTSSEIKDSLEDVFKDLDSKNYSKEQLIDYLKEQYKKGVFSAYQVKRIYKRYVVDCA